jgi:hypothetical protein
MREWRKIKMRRIFLASIITSLFVSTCEAPPPRTITTQETAGAKTNFMLDMLIELPKDIPTLEPKLQQRFFGKAQNDYKIPRGSNTNVAVNLISRKEGDDSGINILINHFITARQASDVMKALTTYDYPIGKIYKKPTWWAYQNTTADEWIIGCIANIECVIFARYSEYLVDIDFAIRPQSPLTKADMQLVVKILDQRIARVLNK